MEILSRIVSRFMDKQHDIKYYCYYYVIGTYVTGSITDEMFSLDDGRQQVSGDSRSLIVKPARPIWQITLVT